MTTPSTYRRIRSRVGAMRALRSSTGQIPSAALASLLAPIGPADPTAAPGPTVVLLNDCRDQVNYGASVLVDGLVAILQASIPNAVIVPIPSHWLMDTSGGFEAFLDDGLGMRSPVVTFPTMADQFESIADEWMAGDGGPDAHEFLSRLQGADLVILNGEGSIYRTNQSAVRELFLAWLAKDRLGIPTIFANGMVHLTDVVPTLPGMVRKTFQRLDAVAVREPYSLRNLQQYVPEVQARLFPDSAFMFAADVALETPAVQAIRDQIGDSTYFCFDPGAMPMDHRSPRRSALYDLIVRLKQVAPQALLVNSSPADGYIKQIAAETGSLYIDTIADYREYMALVADAQFIVTGRYHNPMLAAIVGTPSITFASANHKVHGTCEMLDGLVGVPYDGTYLRPQLDAIEQQARRYVEERDDIRAKLLEVCRRRKTEAALLGQFAAGALRKDPVNGSARTAEARRQ